MHNVRSGAKRLAVASYRSGVALAVLTTLIVGPALRPLSAQEHAHGAHAPATTRPDTTATGAAAEAAASIRALFAAAERHDLAALDTLYASDSLTVIEGAGINRTWADYRDHHLAPEMTEMKNFRYRPFEMEARTAGNLGWAIFRYALQADVNGRAVDIVGRGTAILERRADRWVVRHTQTSGRPRRPTDPPMPR